MVSYYALRARLAQFAKGHPTIYRVALKVRPLLRFISYPVKLVLGLAWVPRLLSAWMNGAAPKLAPGSGAGLPPQIAMLVISEVWRDPRVEREARALAANGFRVKVIYPDFFSTESNIPSMDWGPGIEFRALPGYFHSFIHSFPYLLGSEFLNALRDERPFAYHAHDLTTALIGLVAASSSSAHIVCDFHEWYSENVSWDVRKNCHIPHPWIKKSVYRIAELMVMHRASAVVTVCDSIANDMSSGRYLTRRKVEVIRNIPSITPPETRSLQNWRAEIGISPNRFVVLWQGGVGPSRLLEPIIEAFGLIPDATLVIRGPAIERFGPEYVQLAQAHGAGNRVFCLPPVPSAQVVDAAASADVGVWSLPNLCKNFYYALPNKIFEYLAAGLPIVGADFPEVRRIVKRYEVGLCFDPYDPNSIAKQINLLANNPDLVSRFRQNAAAALIDMRADREWERLADLYRRLLPAQIQ